MRPAEGAFLPSSGLLPIIREGPGLSLTPVSFKHMERDMEHSDLDTVPCIQLRVASCGRMAG